MNSTVQIDDDQVRAELAAIEQEQQPAPVAPEVAAPGAEPQPTPAPPDWSMAAAGIVGLFDRVIAPNWQLSEDEQRALFESTRQVLTAFFPDALDPRVQACFALGGTVLAIAGARRDPATGKMKPLRLKKPEEPVKADGAAQRAAA